MTRRILAALPAIPANVSEPATEQPTPADFDAYSAAGPESSLSAVLTGTARATTASLPPDRRAAKANLLQYVSEVPSDPTNLGTAHPALQTAFAKIRIGNAWYLGSPNASRVVVAIPGGPVDANYLVPFFTRVQSSVADQDTAILLLPSMEPKMVSRAINVLKSVQTVTRLDFFTHSGGSVTIHRMQNQGLLPKETATFAATSWVEGGDYQSRPDSAFPPEPLDWEPSNKPENRGVRAFKKQLASLGRYYFPQDLWNDPECRTALLGLIDGMRFVGTGPLVNELLYVALHQGSDRALVELQNAGVRVLAFSGLDDPVVMPEHSERAFATAAGTSPAAIPDSSFWTDGKNVWAPQAVTRHFPMFEYPDEMAATYAAFLKLGPV